MQVKVKLTTEEAAHIAQSAIPASRYWAETSACVGVDTTLFVKDHASSPSLEMDAYQESSKCLWDGPAWGWRVRKADIERGLGLAIEHGYASVTGSLTTGKGVAYLDGPACDVVVQLAVFGKLLYG